MTGEGYCRADCCVGSVNEYSSMNITDVMLLNVLLTDVGWATNLWTVFWTIDVFSVVASQELLLPPSPVCTYKMFERKSRSDYMKLSKLVVRVIQKRLCTVLIQLTTTRQSSMLVHHNP